MKSYTLDLETVLWSLQNLLPSCSFQYSGNDHEFGHDHHQELGEEEKRQLNSNGRAWKNEWWQREGIPGPGIEIVFKIHPDEKEEFGEKQMKN